MKSSPPRHGGRRAGAGKPKGVKWPSTIAKEAARELLTRQVIASMEPMTAAQIEAAQGVHQFIYREPDGRFKVIDDPDEVKKRIADGSAISLFTRLPSTPAYTDLMNRALDKPKEQVQEVHVSGSLTLEEKLAKALKRSE